MAQLNMPLDGDVHRRLRVACAQLGVKQHEFVTAAIREAVERQEAAEDKRRRR